jgi:hypothetical protein
MAVPTMARMAVDDGRGVGRWAMGDGERESRCLYGVERGRKEKQRGGRHRHRTEQHGSSKRRKTGPGGGEGGGGQLAADEARGRRLLLAGLH